MADESFGTVLKRETMLQAKWRVVKYAYTLSK